MTPERLAEIEARAEAATLGPWYRVGPPWNDDVAYVIAGDEDPHMGTFVCDIAALADEGNANDVPDAEFIAHARADVPALVAEVRRLAKMRLVLAVFGVPKDAPQPFALCIPGDKQPLGLGVKWPGGAVTIKWTPPERLATVTSASLEDALIEHPDMGVIWLSEDLGSIAEHEERADRAEAEIRRLRALTQ